MNIIDLSPDQPEHIQAAARLLITGFQQMAPHAWPDMASALEEVQESLACDRISRVLLNDGGMVIGWIVGILPDASGFGKPDILMAKRVANIETR